MAMMEAGLLWCLQLFRMGISSHAEQNVLRRGRVFFGGGGCSIWGAYACIFLTGTNVVPKSLKGYFRTLSLPSKRTTISEDSELVAPKPWWDSSSSIRKTTPTGNSGAFKISNTRSPTCNPSTICSGSTPLNVRSEPLGQNKRIA